MSGSDLPTTELEEEWLIALTKLIITNAPGQIPSVTKVRKGERFQLDGDEQVDVARLFQVRAIAVYTGSPEQEALRQTVREENEKERNNPLKRKARERRLGNG